MGAILRKYATATAAGTHIMVPMPKAGSADFATGSDWTPAAGDVKVSIDGGAQANITTLPTYSNGQWVFQLSGTELTGKAVNIAIVDSATKAVDDQFIKIETFGHASAMYTVDWTVASGKLPATVASGDDDDAAFVKANVGANGAALTAIGDTRIAALIAGVNISSVGGQTATAAGPVAFPSSIGTSTYSGGAVASVTAPVTAGTVTDKTGYSLAVAPPTAAQIRAEIDANSTWVATITTNLNATVSSRSTLDASGVRGAVGLAAANLDTQLAAIGLVTNRLNTAIQPDGATGYQFTVTALALAPAGGGGGTTDWTSTERSQIRYRLGIDGTAVMPTIATQPTVKLSADGLDGIQVETGVNARQALSPILAASAGVLTGAGSGTVVIKGGNVAVTRITATTDSSGNRTAITLALPA